MTAFGCVPRASVCPCARCVEAKTSPSSIAWQTPTAVASWPIATCRKPGQLAGAEALLDLLLEAADQQHLAQEVAQPVLRERARFFSTFATGSSLTTPLCSAVVWRSLDTWDEIESGLAGDWTTRRSARARGRGRGGAGERAARAAQPVAHGHRGAALRRRARNRDARRTPSAGRSQRLEDEGIDGTLELVRLDERGRRRPRWSSRRSRASWDGLLATLPPDWSDLLPRGRARARATTSTAPR